MLLLWNIFGDSISGLSALSTTEMTQLINREDAKVVDIRGEKDYSAGHIINAINIPQAEFENQQKQLDKLKQEQVVLYCQSGDQSARATRYLQQAGFENIAFLRGGLLAWQNANLPITKQTG